MTTVLMPSPAWAASNATPKSAIGTRRVTSGPNDTSPSAIRAIARRHRDGDLASEDPDLHIASGAPGRPEGGGRAGRAAGALDDDVEGVRRRNVGRRLDPEGGGDREPLSVPGKTGERHPATRGLRDLCGELSHRTRSGHEDPVAGIHDRWVEKTVRHTGERLREDSVELAQAVGQPVQIDRGHHHESSESAVFE
jgi:hypothetical protein